MGQEELAGATRNGSEISGTGSAPATVDPLTGRVGGSAAEPATVDGSDQMIRRPGYRFTGIVWGLSLELST